jgi:hypothetical protein
VEAVVACFTLLSRHLPGGTEDNHEKLSQWPYCLKNDVDKTEFFAGFISPYHFLAYFKFRHITKESLTIYLLVAHS